MTDPIRIRLAPGCSIVVANGDGEVTVSPPDDGTPLIADPRTLRLLECLSDEGLSADSFARGLGSAVDLRGNQEAVCGLSLLASLGARRRLHYACGVPSRPAAWLVPGTPSFRLQELPASSARFLLSRFTHLRAESGSWWIESPAGTVRIRIGDAYLPWVDRLRCPSRAEDLSPPDSEPARTVPPAHTFLQLLFSGKAVVPCGADGAPHEDPRLHTWEPHDLFFHTSSRTGYLGTQGGATFRFAATLPPPLLRKSGDSPRIPLARSAGLERTDPPFQEVVEKRRSRRVQGNRPIGLDALGELLYRSARTRRLFEQTIDGASAPLQIASRVTPSGGALHEIELHLFVSACEGLEPGVYRYDSVEHALKRRDGLTPPALALLDAGRANTGQSARNPHPQVLIVLAAHFARVSWKYERIAYALILKNAGVLLHALGLAAEAMGLAACILGSGDSERFAAATGLHPFEVGPVGEFVVGSRASPETETTWYRGCTRQLWAEPTPPA